MYGSVGAATNCCTFFAGGAGRASHRSVRRVVNNRLGQSAKLHKTWEGCRTDKGLPWGSSGASEVRLLIRCSDWLLRTPILDYYRNVYKYFDLEPKWEFSEANHNTGLVIVPGTPRTSPTGRQSVGSSAPLPDFAL